MSDPEIVRQIEAEAFLSLLERDCDEADTYHVRPLICALWRVDSRNRAVPRLKRIGGKGLGALSQKPENAN